MIKQFLNDSKVFLLFRIISSVSWLISIFFLSKILEPADYGTFILINTTILLSVTFFSTWISSSIIRFFPEYILLNFQRRIIINSLIYVTLTSLLILISFLILVNTIKFSNLIILSFAGVWFLLQSITSILITYFRADRQILIYSIFNTWQNVGGFLIGGSISLIFDNGVFGLIIGFCLSNLLSIILLFYFIYKKYHVNVLKINFSIEVNILKKFFYYGSPLVLLNLFSQGLSNCDKYFVNYFFGEKITGIYSASYMIAEQSIFVIISIFSTVSAPLLFKLWKKKDYIEINSYLSMIFKYYLVFSLPILLIMGIFNKQIARLFLNDNYSVSFGIIPIVCLGAFFLGLATLYTDILTAAMKPLRLMYCYLIAFFINIILNIYFIPQNEIYGAAYATLLTYLSMYILVIIYTRNIFKWTINIRSTSIILFSSFIMFLVMFFLNEIIIGSYFYFIIIIGSILFFMLLIIFRQINIDDFKKDKLN